MLYSEVNSHVLRFLQEDFVKKRTLHKEITSDSRRRNCILLVEDDQRFRDMVAEALVMFTDLLVYPVESVDQARGLLSEQWFCRRLKLVVTDLHLPGTDGLTFYYILASTLPNVSRLVMSGGEIDQLTDRARQLGRNFISKEELVADGFQGLRTRLVNFRIRCAKAPVRLPVEI